MLQVVVTKFRASSRLAVTAVLAGIAALAAGLPAERQAAAAPPPISGPPTSAMPQSETLQIVVFEAPGCIYCSLFRRHVEPAYAASPRAQNMPMRFIDLNAPDAERVGIATPVDTVPTAILLQNNREIGRVPGYVGPEIFFHAINHILAVAE
ncbi:MAG: thioredoxin family protein [Hyphomicrobiaceae bacterium]|nr:thioredoxin family protein [Hyphomicrobiaceae bacterium]